jgi:hypothetical protein
MIIPSSITQRSTQELQNLEADNPLGPSLTSYPSSQERQGKEPAPASRTWGVTASKPRCICANHALASIATVLSGHLEPLTSYIMRDRDWVGPVPLSGFVAEGRAKGRQSSALNLTLGVIAPCITHNHESRSLILFLRLMARVFQYSASCRGIWWVAVLGICLRLGRVP